LMETVLNFDKFFEEAAQMLKKVKGFLYMGRGVHYPIALEGALKLKELAYMHAEGYAAGEMKHGPLALIDEEMVIVMLAPSDELYEKTVSNLEEAKARGGHIISLGTGDNKKLKALSDYYLPLPQVEPHIYPFLEVIPLQLLSYHVAHSLGHDVDQPRNLAKSVTVE
jgi:glutamine---fructose-6-phosphate transaminase (isomerizing)